MGYFDVQALWGCLPCLFFLQSPVECRLSCVHFGWLAPKSIIEK